MKIFRTLLIIFLLVGCTDVDLPIYDFTATIYITVEDRQTDTGVVLNTLNVSYVLRTEKGITEQELRELQSLFIAGTKVVENEEANNITIRVTSIVIHEIN